MRDAVKAFMAQLKAKLAVILPKVAESQDELRKMVALFKDKSK